MKMILNEVLESLKRRKWFSALIAIQVTVLFLTSALLFLTYTHIEGKSDRLQPLKELNFYQLSDDLASDSKFQAFLKRPNSLQIIKKFYKNLEHRFGKRFVYLFNQHIDVKIGDDPKWDKFLYGYEHGAPIEQLKKHPYNPLKAVQINEQGFTRFSIPLSNGHPFSAQDFHYRQGEAVPVLLGAEYQPFYQVGDEIKTKYLRKDFKLVVRGFIQPDTFVFNANNPELYLDRYIVMPALQFSNSPKNEADERFQKIHYMQLINGMIFTNEKPYVVRRDLEQVKKASGFTDMQLIGANSDSLDFVFSVIRVNVELLQIMSSALFVVCILSISILMVTKFQDNFRNMSIHLSSGATLNQLFSYFLAEILFIVGLPGLVITLWYKQVIDVSFGMYTLMNLMLFSLTVLISALPLYWQFSKIEISSLLKRSE
ncbi:hypothetical protein C8P63_14616 [Melghirimyces profundicolus]|uniref:Uncharacterized protein n=1 Tax=Melghirimyces profundicolus TaxID=1242148 RepID=A0A2T6AWV3_9BACL|nr:ABC transporter permease [Melghirimyces profundicolus]PTX48307.1 hypothetical protein C8P63_14616 [Melghirimyces profundicolus]